MKKTIAILLALCLCVGLCACSKSPTAVEKALEHINNGQLQEAYALLFAIESRTGEEEALLASFSFVETEIKIENTSGARQVDTYNAAGYLVERLKTASDGTWEKTTYRE